MVKDFQHNLCEIGTEVTVPQTWMDAGGRPWMMHAKRGCVALLDEGANDVCVRGGATSSSPSGTLLRRRLTCHDAMSEILDLIRDQLNHLPLERKSMRPE